MLFVAVILGSTSIVSAQVVPTPTSTVPVPPSAPSASLDPNGISRTVPLYSQFDLFKNTGFFPCPVNGNTTADRTTKDFLVTRNVASQTDFCSFLAGTPIMIPTLADQLAFFPWYPTFLAQAFSLGASYMGLFYTLRIVDRSRMLPSRRVPWHFWIQLPVDFARVIAFLFKTVHGFVDSSRFAWVNVLLWLLPLNYVYLSSQLRTSQRVQYEEPYAGANQQLAQLRAQQNKSNQMSFMDQGLRSDFKSPGTLGSGTFPSLRTSLPSDLRNRSTRGASVWIWIIITAVMWFFSFVAMILHWKWAFAPGTIFARTYEEIPVALLDPRTIATMPVTCLRYLQSGALAQNDFMTNNTDQLMFSLITTFQFLLSSAVLAAVFLGRREPFDRAYLVLYISAAVTLAMILIPAFAVGIDIVAKVLKQKRVISVRFTNDLTVTGGCTFAFVNMNKRLGYWDVPVERGFRIVMSFLGAG